MAKHTFIEYVGNYWIKGKAVAAYRVDEDTVQLRGETPSGKIIGMPRNVSNDKFQKLKSEWSVGVLSVQEAEIVERGLKYLGVV